MGEQDNSKWTVMGFLMVVGVVILGLTLGLYKQRAIWVVLPSLIVGGLGIAFISASTRTSDQGPLYMTTEKWIKYAVIGGGIGFLSWYMIG